MNKALQTTAWVAGGLLVYNLVMKAIGLKTMQFYPDKIVSISWQGINPVFEVALIAQNTSFQNATVYSMAGQILSDGYWIGNVYNFIPQTIAPNSSSRVTVFLKLSWMGVVQKIVSAFESGIYGAEFTVQGNANVESFNVPINLKFKIGQ